MPAVVLWKTAALLGPPPATDGPWQPSVRPMTTADVEAVRSVAIACGLIRQPVAGRLESAGILAELASRPGRHVRAWVAAVDASSPVIGLVTLVVAGPPPGRCSVGWLLVHPAARRRGVAAALVAAALDAARAGGQDRVCVETLTSWADAMAFWRAMGFTARR